MSGYSYVNIDDVLRIGTSFDLIKREIMVADKNAYLYYIDEFAKDELMEKLQEFFYSLKPEDLTGKAKEFTIKNLPYLEVDYSDDTEKIVTDILSGVSCLIIDGYDEAILIDSRTYPARSVEEPEKDKSLRGSRDGFIETIVSNVGLIRRRIRNPNLTVRAMKMGTSSKTDIAICYMEDKVDRELLKKVIDRIESSNIDSLTMNQESFVNVVFKRKWYNPLPKFKFTERPDTAAASISEGKIAVMVDNSPSAIIFPMTLFDITEEANDYYFPRITGTYLRISRFIITMLSLFITPLYLYGTMNPDIVPKALEFTAVKDTVNIPVFLQLIILEVAIDGMKLAAITTPNMLSTPLSVIAALIIGDFAASSGWFNSESMLYMSFVAIAYFMHESYELGYAIKFMRIFLLVLIALFNGWGFIAGIIAISIFLTLSKAVDGKGYFYPLIPFNAKELFRRITLK